MATNSKAKHLTRAFSIIGILLAITLFVLMSFGAYTVSTEDIGGMETILNILLLMGPTILLDLGLLGALLIA
ncbi:MAG: hypothetical protein MJ219_04525 [Mycoplasmoidaceae bacterium]|nr:hypothetical protein [Mycoplasmoidaceae bacterium]